MKPEKTPPMKFETAVIHAGQSPDPQTGAVMTPIYATSTYAQSSPGEHKGFDYARTRNPTRDALERCIAELEGGTTGFAFSSGMAAIGTVRMPKHPFFRIQTIGLAGFAAVLALVGVVLLLPPVRDRIQDIYWFSAKVGVFMYLYIWYRGTFPRYRFDQLMKVGWKVMIPMSLAALILTALVGVRTELWTVVKDMLGKLS